MCGRYTLRVSPAELAQIFAVLREPGFTFPPRYNIAPTQSVPIVRVDEGGQRELALVRWGLVPSWVANTKMSSRLINARAETVATMPAFRDAFKKRRCIVPADQFYEWQVAAGQKQKQPYAIGLAEPGVMGFAGIWESWHDDQAASLETCSIITTTPNRLVAKLHDRMPVILNPDNYERWLTTPEKRAADLQSLLTPYPADKMLAWKISTRVNAVRNEGPEILEPART